jgi:hypothetical protein
MRDLSRGVLSLALASALITTPKVAVAAPAEVPEAEAQPDAEAGEDEPSATPDGESPEPERGEGEGEGEAVADPEAGEGSGEPQASPPEVAPPAPEPSEDEPPLDTDEDEPPLDTDEDEDLAGDLDVDEDEVFDDDYQVLRHSPEAVTARRWLAAGIAATITGSVLVGGAIALSQTAPCDPNAGNNCFADARDRGAVTMGVPGGVLLVGGIAMTVVGALQRRRLWRSLALAPGVSPTQLGLVVSGRF